MFVQIHHMLLMRSKFRALFLSFLSLSLLSQVKYEGENDKVNTLEKTTKLKVNHSSPFRLLHQHLAPLISCCGMDLLLAQHRPRFQPPTDLEGCLLKLCPGSQPI